MHTLKRGLAAGAACALLAWGVDAVAQTAAPETAPPTDGDGLGGPTETSPTTPAAAEAAPEPPAPAAAPPPTISDAVAGGKLLLEIRARYEFVDQKKTAVLRDNGEAFTVRTRLG